MGRLTWFMEASAHYITLWIGEHYGSTFPMHFVCGYPRSGTTWFSEMLASYLNLPRPNHYRLPLAFASVVHTHAEPKSKLDDCFYIVRDGRDAVLSHYFMIVRAVKNNPDFVHRDRYLKLFGAPFDADNIDHNLPLFIEYTLSQPRNSSGRRNCRSR